MDNFETELEQFLLWFTDQEAIPAQTRVDFLSHIVEIGHLDEKAEKFVTDTLTHLAETSKNQADELKARYERLQRAVEAQEDPEISIAENVLRDAEENIASLADSLKSEFQEFEQEKSTAAEAGEKEEESAEIEQLKQNL